jgi:hypothetical protein
MLCLKNIVDAKRRKIKMNKTYKEELKEKFARLMTKEELSHMDEIVIDADREPLQDPPFIHYPISDRWDIVTNLIQSSLYISRQYRKRRIETELEVWDIPKSIHSAVINELP